MDRDDPRLEVEAPVRRALRALVWRGLALVGATLFVVLLPSMPGAQPLAAPAAIATPLVLFAFAGVALLERRLRGRPDEEHRAAAWFRAREVDEADATLALLVAGWVPVALLAALVVLVWPHLGERDVTSRGIWSIVGLPTLATAWLVTTTCWLETSRDLLARALVDSEARFRSYWARPGGG